MKKFQIFTKSLLLTGIIALTAACNGDDSPGGTGSPSGTYIMAKVDGSSFDARVMGVSTAGAVRSGTGDMNLIQITGADANGRAMTLGIFGVTQPGTYQINPDTDSVGAYIDGVGTSTASYDTGECTGASGSIVVTQVSDTQVEGTFSFTGKSEENGCAAKSVTEGSFRGIFMQ
ncbi:MAG: hypothetical protein EOP49_19965 [Sphingobacteriales bacterium]|nr:MAG: hypothetical protein EOP49_19965 [Sphingobacteriales bacterium]